MNFLRISIEFQSLQLEITKRSLKHYSNESWAMQITPWGFVSSTPRSLAGLGRGTGKGAPYPGGVCHRRRGEGGQGARGDHGAPVEGLGWG